MQSTRNPISKLAAVTLVSALGLSLGACPGRGKKLKTGKAFAKAWKNEYSQYFDDELDARRLVKLTTDEPFAQKALQMLAKRIEKADLVMEGQISNVANMERSDGSTRLAVLIQVTDMLRGARKDLPDGKQRVSLFMAQGHPEINPKELVGQSAIVFLRWRPKGQKPPFNWHGNLVCRETRKDINRLLAKRAKKELKNQ